MINTIKTSLAFIGAFAICMMIYSYTFNTEEESVGTKSQNSTVNDSDTLSQIVDLPQKVKSVSLYKDYYFANEKVPTDNFDVRERLIKELTVNSYYHSSTTQSILRSGRYFPIMRRILAEEGVPSDFVYLAVAESNMENVTSPAGAKGFWQFMPATARHYGLEISSTIDERYHLEKSTRAACKLIKDYKERFGTWTLAAAAYNAGETRIARNMKAQKADSYYDLNLNRETSRYMFRIIAIKEILSSPQTFGFFIESENQFGPLPKYQTVTVDESIYSLGEFATDNGISYRMLKVYNPWLLDGKLIAKNGKSYDIKLPIQSTSKQKNVR